MRSFLLSLFLFSTAWIYAQDFKPIDEYIYLADPTVFYEDGTYYLYGTGGDSEYGFLVYTSIDMKNWNGPVGVSGGYALKKGDTFGDKGFWAPQIFKYQDAYYMAYTANEFIAIASAPHPTGPFTQKKIQKIPTNTRLIDPYVFFDEDGRIYLYHVRLDNGNRLYVAELTEDLTAIKEDTLKECIVAEETWENTQNAEWPVAEGPTIIKEKGKYYFFYSANDFRNIDYAVGYAMADSPYGPWKKYENNPIIVRQLLNQYGTGHGDLIKDSEDNLWYVFHTHFSDSKTAPRRTAFIRLKTSIKNGTLHFEADPESFYFPTRVNN